MKIIFILMICFGFSIKSNAEIINFDKDGTGKPPKDFFTELTGKGKPGNWIVVQNPTAQSKPNVLAQTDMDKTGYRFPLCIYNKFYAKDVDLKVKFMALKGKGDQGAGLVWKYSDRNNYYVVRANALEDNVVLYRVINGKREDLAVKGKGKTYGVMEKVSSKQWHELRCVAKGSLFTIYFDGKNIFQVEDKTFGNAGKIGLWTKADSYIIFDDLEFSEIR